MKYTVVAGQRTFDVEIVGSTVRLNGNEFEAELRDIPGTPLVCLRTSRAVRTFVLKRDPEWWIVESCGERVTMGVLDERARAVRAAAEGHRPPEAHGVIRAPMPGRVLRIEVAHGDRVAQGTGLVVLEAMKMENEIRSPGAGTVQAVLVEPGAAVEKGAPLVEIISQG
jgi:pyruvate carboxylase subunit B